MKGWEWREKGGKSRERRERRWINALKGGLVYFEEMQK